MLHIRHSGHDHGGNPMEVSMDTRIYNNYDLQKKFWIFIGSIVALATVVNIIDYIIFRQRLLSRSAKPVMRLAIVWASVTSVGRELFSAAFPSLEMKRAKIPPILAGPTFLMFIYAMAVMVFCFIGTNSNDPWSWEDVAVRIGCINQAQLPLLFLLAGKQSIIRWLTGLAYERINWLHRWTARILWVGVTMHMGFFFRSWMRWDYVKVKIVKDSMTQTGLAAWCILTAILLLSFAPVRRWNYEFFLVSHIILFAGLIGTAMIHVTTGTEYVWACVVVFLLDRVIRLIVMVVCNVPLGRGSNWWWANYAMMTPLPEGLTRITINNPIVSWKPGQHMLVSCHGLVPLQSHPFTISSLPADGKMEFLVQSQTGATRRFHRWALTSSVTREQVPRMIIVEGPYGYLRPLYQFDAVVLIAGSTGATFTVPLMRDIVQRWVSGQSFVTTLVHFVWVIRSKNCLSWFADELGRAEQAVDELHNRGVAVKLDVSIHVTCGKGEALQSGCDPSDEQSQRPTNAITEHLVEGKRLEVSEAEILLGGNEGHPEKRCCCRGDVEHEQLRQETTCHHESTSSNLSFQESPTLSTSIPKIISRRPYPREIIRKALESAAGETAVVVCGSWGLCNDVRRTTVSLSDERAVHKGTGAQGIYLHVEGFEY